MSDLEKLLDQEKRLVVLFLDLLRKEQAALIANDTQALPALGEQKLTLVSQLNAVEAQRTMKIGASASENSQSSMLRWLDQHPGEQAARPLWLKIIALARVARQMHNMNGELITMHLAKTNEALSILLQKEKDQALYGSDGQRFGGTGSRILDQA